MPAGIELYNTHGTVQINSSSRALAYSQWLGGGVPVASGVYVDVVASPHTMIAMRPQTNGSRCTFRYRQHLGGSTYRYFFGGSAAGLYQFEPMVTPTAKVGLQVFNGAGECMFDSAQLPMLAVAILGPTAASIPVPAGKTYAVVTLSRSYSYQYERWTDLGVWYVREDMWQSNFWATPGWIHYHPDEYRGSNSGISDPSNPLPGDYSTGSPLYYVIDVTGY